MYVYVDDDDQFWCGVFINLEFWMVLFELGEFDFDFEFEGCLLFFGEWFFLCCFECVCVIVIDLEG